MIAINNKEKCNGCHACMNVCPRKCIHMKQDAEGFYYPEAEAVECSNCGLCEKVCPILNKDKINSKSEETKGYAFINQQNEIRKKSTSGGAFYLLACCILEQGGVVYGAAFDEKYQIIHIRVEDTSELCRLMGSKYVQSRIGRMYSEVKSDLRSGRLVLFTGTPCQIGGLKCFLQCEYDNLYLLDIICHGVPSPLVWESYLSELKKKYHSDVCHIEFRNKENGWKNYNIRVDFKNKRSLKRVYYEDPYLRGFVSNITLRPSCYECAYKSLERVSDITLGDFWGIWNINNDMYDDKGTSLVVSHTDKGEFILSQVLEKHKLVSCNLREAVEYNPSAIKSVEKNAERELFFNELQGHKKVIQLLEKYSGITLRMKIKRKVKELLRK